MDRNAYSSDLSIDENEKNLGLKRLPANLSMDEKIELVEKTKHILGNGLRFQDFPN